MIQITPECTIAEFDDTCRATGNEDSVSEVFEGLMTDNGNGSYSYTYTPTQAGTSTVSIWTLAPGGLRVVYTDEATLASGA